jgi:hypothetical protein
MKIRSVEAEVFLAGGRTDGHDAANSRFSQFAKALNSMVTSQNVLVLSFNRWLALTWYIRNPSYKVISPSTSSLGMY